MGKEEKVELTNNEIVSLIKSLADVLLALSSINDRLDMIEQIMMNHKEHIQDLEVKVFKKEKVEPVKEYIH